MAEEEEKEETCFKYIKMKSDCGGSIEGCEGL